MKNILYLIIGLIVLFDSCKQETIKPPVSVRDRGKILVLNEGNFSWGNASVALYNPKSSVLSLALFESINNRPLGDVLQTAKIIDGNIWLVVNNSGKIEVIDTSSFKSIKTIIGLRSPRYLTELNGVVYVTELFGEKINTINATTFDLLTPINASGWTEHIEAGDQMLYFINKDSNSVMTYNPLSLNVNILNIIGTPFDLVKQNTEIYAASYQGDSLIIRNLSKGTERIYADVLTNVPESICYSELLQLWYVKMGNQLSRLNKSGKLETIHELKTGSLYGAEIIGDEIYLSNAKDYVENSELIRIDMEGNVLDKQESGRITNGFLSLE